MSQAKAAQEKPLLQNNICEDNLRMHRLSTKRSEKKRQKKYCKKGSTKGNDVNWRLSQAQLKATITAMRERGDFDEYGIAYCTVAEISRK